jgi:hypothetical protein
MSALFGGSWHATTWLFNYSNVQGVNLMADQYVTQAYAVSVADAVRFTGANLEPPPIPVFRRAFLVDTESLHDESLFLEEPPKSTAIEARIFRLAADIEACYLHDEQL